VRLPIYPLFCSYNAPAGFIHKQATAEAEEATQGKLNYQIKIKAKLGHTKLVRSNTAHDKTTEVITAWYPEVRGQGPSRLPL
jgi:hypothetical protein